MNLSVYKLTRERGFGLSHYGILCQLQLGTPLTVSELADRLFYRPEHIRTACLQLLSAGLLTRHRTKRTTTASKVNPYYYSLCLPANNTTLTASTKSVPV